MIVSLGFNAILNYGQLELDNWSARRWAYGAIFGYMPHKQRS